MLRYLLAIICAAAVGGLWAAGADPRQSLTPQEGVLLLANGQVLEGRIVLAAGQYHVALAAGEIRVASADVQFFCRDLEEGYQLKCRAAEPGQIQEHLNLVEWCLRHGMTGYAAKQFQQAISLDPTHPKITLLDRRLKLSTAAATAPPAAGPKREPAPSPDELERLTQSLPKGAMESFTGSIQPLLMNHCATAGCHGPASKGSLRLSRMPAERSPTRRLTQRNLYATLAAVDRENPSESKLLTMPIKPHGAAKTAVFSQRDETRFKQLVAWVHRVSETPMPDRPASVEEAAPLLQTKPSDEETITDDEMESDGSADEAPEPDVPPHRRRGRMTSAPTPKPWAPADPFDPEIFNRQ